MSRTFLLQDWVTIRSTATSSTSPFVQDEERWLDLAGYSDASCWIDIAEVTPPGGTSSNFLTLALETSAVCDDAYFTNMAPSIAVGAATPYNQASPTPLVLRSGRSVSSANLLRYLRWKIVPNTTGLWDVTFRIRVVATRSSTFVPTDIAGCNLWLRSDLGVTANSAASITSWKDQSGVGNDAAPGTSPTYVMGGVNGLPTVHVTSGQYLTGNFPVASPVSKHTLFAVVSYGTPLANKAAFAATDASNAVNSGFSQFTETPTGIIGRAGASSVSFASAVTTDTTSLGNVSIYSTAADSNATVDLYVNGLSKATASTTGMTLNPCPKYFLFQLGGAAYPFIGDAYEFILYNTVLSAADRRRIHRYLGARYNITVP